jgi:ABC-type antimicrobial peptide transport system permease subunit
MRQALLVIGIIAALTGLVWIGQGTGYFPYPEQSFMVRATQWVWYGLVVLVAGLIAMWLSRRL